MARDDEDPHRSGADARRQALRLGSAALALGALGAAAPARAAGGATVPRARWLLHNNFVPQVDTVCLLPWKIASFNTGIDCTLEDDGRILMNEDGLYRVSLGTDWVAQQGFDIDLRKVGIRRNVPTAPLRRAHPLVALDKTDDHLASCDVPGSSVPKTARWQGAWTPGTIAPGAMATMQVALVARTTLLPGDLVLASHAKLCDAAIGAAATDALVVSAKVVAPNTVRVSIANLFSPTPVTVPSGQLNVLAMTAVATCGESNDAWHVTHSPLQAIDAGDRIYAVCRSLTDGDYLQSTKSTFLQIERVA